MERIISRHNALVREFRALADPSGARARGDADVRILLDGAHLLDEAIASELPIEVVAVRDTLVAGPLGTLAQRAASAGARQVAVTESVLTALSPVRQPSGIVAIARRTPQGIESALECPPQLLLLLSDIQDPGNVGAIIRVADACGATGIITSGGTADPFGWKALRGAMGSTFHLPVAVRQSLGPAVAALKARGIKVYAAVPRQGTPLPRCDLRVPAAVLLGGEGPGLAADLASRADERLTIPMKRTVDSLNVATAAALIVYEAQRQREGAAR